MVSSRHDEAKAAATEALHIASDIGQVHRIGQLEGVLAWLAAISGDAERCQSLADRIDQTVETGRVMGAWALGLLRLGLGRPRDALQHLAPLWHEDHRHQPIALYAAPDLIEAAVRSDRPELATLPLSRFEHWAEATSRPWATAIAARSRGLVGDGDPAGRHFADSLRLFESAPEQRFERARSELLYGEWLRRGRHRTDARQHLRTAFDVFDQIGAEPWTQRARAELRATGEAAVPQARGPLGRLTPQELQVVRLASSGLSNREIGAQLFLSPRTVGHHLYKAFPKLGVGSRHELADLVPTAS